MAVDTSKGHPDMDYAEHERTYKGFLKLFIYGIATCVAILALMALFLV